MKNKVIYKTDNALGFKRLFYFIFFKLAWNTNNLRLYFLSYRDCNQLEYREAIKIRILSNLEGGRMAGDQPCFSNFIKRHF